MLQATRILVIEDWNKISDQSQDSNMAVSRIL